MARFFTAAVVALVLLFSVGCATEHASDLVVREDSTKREQKQEETGSGKYSIYLITMDQGSAFWQQIDAGCKRAVRELGDIRYRWLAPPEHDSDEQGACIDEAVSDGADAILLSAISPTDINENLARASAKGVKIVYVDSAATYGGVVTLMTDNEAAGRIAAKTMQEALSEKGIISGVVGIAMISDAQNALLREKGFREAMEGTEFTVAPPAYMNGSRQNIKDYVMEHPGYVGFFGTNSQTTQAIGEQMKDSGRRQVVIGFDTADVTLSLIEEGVIYATMQQNPEKMGYDGIGRAVQALKGEYAGAGSVEDTGVRVITREKL